MFHRKNLTLSARTLSNRLNLGTRSFALVANVKNGGHTLRTRHAHHDVLREGMVWDDVSPDMPGKYVILSIPGSFSKQPCQPGCQPEQPEPAAEVIRVIPAPRPANLDGRPGASVRDGLDGMLSASVALSERCSRSSERSSGWRSERRAPETASTGHSARCAARFTAAAFISAASPGK